MSHEVRAAGFLFHYLSDPIIVNVLRASSYLYFFHFLICNTWTILTALSGGTDGPEDSADERVDGEASEVTQTAGWNI